MENEEYTKSSRFVEYPRWSTITSMFLHFGVHIFGTIVLTTRLHATVSSGVNMQLPDGHVTVMEIHAIAAAMAIMLRDFLMFKMDWMFWAHHATCVIMSTSLYLFAMPTQWLICVFVCAAMESGSGGYDVFIVASEPTEQAAYIYQGMMILSHTLTIWGMVTYALQDVIPQGPVFWVFMPIMFIFIYIRQTATGSLIKAEADRQQKELSGKSK